MGGQPKSNVEPLIFPIYMSFSRFFLLPDLPACGEKIGVIFFSFYGEKTYEVISLMVPESCAARADELGFLTVAPAPPG